MRLRQILILLLLASLFVQAGCQTIRGLGKDVETAGEWMQEKAR